MARWIHVAGLLGTLITAPSTAAEWFFRGTANGWAATAMTSTDGVNFDTCQRFVSGDASGGPRFKMMAPAVYDQFVRGNNWPFGAALAFILLSITLVLTIIGSAALGRRYRRRPTEEAT